MSIKNYLIKKLERYIDDRIETIFETRIERKLKDFADELGFEKVRKLNGEGFGCFSVGIYKWVPKPTTITKEEAEKKLDLKIVE